MISILRLPCSFRRGSKQRLSSVSESLPTCNVCPQTWALLKWTTQLASVWGVIPDWNRHARITNIKHKKPLKNYVTLLEIILPCVFFPSFIWNFDKGICAPFFRTRLRTEVFSCSKKFRIRKHIYIYLSGMLWSCHLMFEWFWSRLNFLCRITRKRFNLLALSRHMPMPARCMQPPRFRVIIWRGSGRHWYFMSKEILASVPKTISSRAKRALGRIFVNMSGLYPEKSTGAATYVMLVKDDYPCAS